MALYSYITTPEEDAALAFVVNQSNASDPLNPQTAGQLMQNSIAGVLKSYVDAMGTAEVEKVRDGYQKADAETRAKVQETLNPKAPILEKEIL